MTYSTHIYKNPEAYSKHNKLQFEFAMDALKSIEVPSSAHVLDIGCGDGIITSYLSEMTPRGCVIGTDISQQMVDHAKVEYKDRRNLNFVQMDASKNIFENKFDVITSFNCLHWVKNQAAALAGISTSANENAKILLLFSHRKSLYHHTLEKVCADKKWREYFKNYVNPRSFFTLGDYKEMLENSQLETIEIVEKEMSHYFESPQALKDFFSASMSQVTHVPDEMKEDFLENFTGEFESQLQLNGINNRPVAFWCLQVNAAKRKI